MTYVTVDFLDGRPTIRYCIQNIHLNVRICDYTLHYLFVDTLIASDYNYKNRMNDDDESN